MAASVWTTLERIGTSAAWGTSYSVLGSDTDPTVATRWSWGDALAGKPTATTVSPALRSDCEPSGMVFRAALSATRMTDMSWQGAAATTWASRFWPSTTTCTWSAPLTTWLLETIRPLSRSSTQPVPPATTPSPVWLMSTSTVAGLTAATISDELGALEPPVNTMTTTTITAISATAPEMPAMIIARLTERRSMIRSMREGVGGALPAAAAPGPPPAAAATAAAPGGGGAVAGAGCSVGAAWPATPLRKFSSVSPIRTRSPP